MANEKFYELGSKIAKGTAEREDKHKFETAIKKMIVEGGATNPQVHYEINELIVRTADEILKPKLDFLEKISDVERVEHGQTIKFQVPQNYKVPMAWTGRGTTVDYQRIGSEKSFVIAPEKIAGGVYYEMDQLASNTVMEFAGLADRLAVDMDTKINARILSTLHHAMASAPARNRYSGDSFSKAIFDDKSSIVQRYGNAVFLGDIDMAKKIADFVPHTQMTEAMKGELNATRLLGTVGGVPITTFTNPFAEDDSTNEEYAVPRNFGYIFQTGYNKPVKVGFEGGLQNFTRSDMESERVFVKVGQKVGVSAITDLRNVVEINDTTLA